MTFESDQEFERAWWGDCANTFGEEAKQITYAHRMGLQVVDDGSGRWPVYDLEGKSVVDLGGGPSSMLLKTINGGRRCVVDPCRYPDWVRARYEAAGIDYLVMPAEYFVPTEPFDEAWIYNVLEHTVEARRIVGVAKLHARRVRVFEWIDTYVSEGHPTVLTAMQLDDWLGARGVVEQVNENGAVGKAWYL